MPSLQIWALHVPARGLGASGTAQFWQRLVGPCGMQRTICVYGDVTSWNSTAV